MNSKKILQDDIKVKEKNITKFDVKEDKNS